jgi:hypothetical protein
VDEEASDFDATVWPISLLPTTEREVSDDVYLSYDCKASYSISLFHTLHVYNSLLGTVSQGVGYAVLLGFGLAFSVITTALVYINRYFGPGGDVTSEHFK